MKKKLTIGFFTDTYTPQINGVVSSIEVFYRELVKLGHEVIIFAPKVGKARDSKNIIRFRAFKFVFQPEYYISVPFNRFMLNKFWKQQLDLVHAHTPFSLGHLGLYYAQIKKVPFVYTYHTNYAEYVKSYVFKGKVLTPKMVAKLNATFCNRVNMNIAPSEKIEKLLKSYGVKRPIEVLPTGIKPELFKKPQNNKFRKDFKIAKDEKVLLFVGRLGKEKNIGFIIKSFALLKNQPKGKLVIVGDGPRKKYLEGLAKNLKIEDKVVFTGYIENKFVKKAYWASDIFLFSSKTETQGMVILEAGICGLPIVAVKDPAFTLMLRDGQNGYLTRENQKDFSQAILKILKNKKLDQRMSLNSKKIAREYTIAKQTKRLVKIYQGLLR